jgi:hypothetical protein
MWQRRSISFAASRGDVSIKLSMEEFALPTAQCINVAALKGDAPIKLLREEFVSHMAQRWRGSNAASRDVPSMP